MKINLKFGSNIRNKTNKFSSDENIWVIMDTNSGRAVERGSEKEIETLYNGKYSNEPHIYVTMPEESYEIELQEMRR